MYILPWTSFLTNVTDDTSNHFRIPLTIDLIFLGLLFCYLEVNVYQFEDMILAQFEEIRSLNTYNISKIIVLCCRLKSISEKHWVWFISKFSIPPRNIDPGIVIDDRKVIERLWKIEDSGLRDCSFEDLIIFRLLEKS